jgi:citrate synthase
MKPTKATLNLDNGTAPIELPVLSGSMGPDVIDIRTLAGHGVLTYDPGFLSTASCSSNITFIDGEKGLLYTAVIPSSNWLNTATFPKWHIC